MPVVDDVLAVELVDARLFDERLVGVLHLVPCVRTDRPDRIGLSANQELILGREGEREVEPANKKLMN